MKRPLNIKRELLPQWMEILELMMDAGEHLAVLEEYDEKKSVADFKRKHLIIKEKILTFVKLNIEPIRLGMKCVPNADKIEQQDNNSSME
jgi:hypothetical protein